MLVFQLRGRLDSQYDNTIIAASPKPTHQHQHTHTHNPRKMKQKHPSPVRSLERLFQ